MFQEKKALSRLNADVRRERQCSGASAVPSPGTDPVLPSGGAGGLAGGQTSPHLQLRNLKSLEKHHAAGNLLLRRGIILNPALCRCTRPTAWLSGEPVPAHCSVGQTDPPWLLREILHPCVSQRCGVITTHYK